MIDIDLIGSEAFCQNYIQAFNRNKTSIHCHTYFIENTIQHLIESDSSIAKNSHLLIEYIETNQFEWILSMLRNGKSIFIEQADLNSIQIHEIYQIATEANNKCIILNTNEYFSIFQQIEKKINTPYFVEMFLEYGIENTYLLNQELASTVNQTMQYLVSIFKSEVKQISIKPAKIFSIQNDFVSIRLDFSNGTSVSIKMSAFLKNENKQIKIYQNEIIYHLNLSLPSISQEILENNQISTYNININLVNRIDCKVKDILNFINNSEMPFYSLLDNYLYMDLTSKIMKKYNSLLE